MKNKFLLTLILMLGSVFFAAAESPIVPEPYDADKYIESDVVPLAGRKGFSFETKNGEFMLKPYVLLQTAGKFNYYDDEQLGLDDQDNVANSGFEIPYAILGFSGRAFNKLTFNLTINAAKTGASLLQQAWVDVNLKDQLRFRVGKFKTPFNQAYLVTLGETLFPTLPTSLTTSLYMGRSINSTPPTFATGFDLGVMMHGLLGGKWEYNVGIFNGTGIDVNLAQKTLSDDLGIPSLLYAGRIAYMPNGPIPGHQGRIDDLHSEKLMFALSASYNVEANWQTTNDFRLGFEFTYLKNRLYLSAEAYFLNSDFVERQRSGAYYNYIGGYVQAGYFVSKKLQPAVRWDFLDRNSLGMDGFLNMPAVGLNYYIMGYNLKLQAMYQFLGRWGHATQDARELDDLGLAQHGAVVMMQFSF